MLIFGGRAQASGIFFNKKLVSVEEEDIITPSKGSELNTIMFDVSFVRNKIESIRNNK